MFKRCLPIVFAVALLLAVAPTRASERINPDQLPVQGLVTGERSREVFLVNGRVAGVVQGEFIYSENPAEAASHYVWHEYNAAGGLVSITEHIVIGDVLYIRRDSAQRWRMGKIGEERVPLPRDVELVWSQLPPAEFPADFLHVFVGESIVEGTPSGQYQAYLKDEKRPAAVREVKIDSFYARPVTNEIENYFIKSVITMSATNPAGTTDVIEYVRVWSDPNVLRSVTAPPAHLVDAFGVRASTAADSLPSLADWTRSHATRSLPR